MFYARDLDRSLVERAIIAWQRAFESEPMVKADRINFGWRVANLDYTQSELTFWAVSLIARLLERSAFATQAEQGRYRNWLDEVASAADVFYPLNDGGWTNVTPSDRSVVAQPLHFGSRVAGFTRFATCKPSVEGDFVESRDASIKQTVGWLVKEHTVNAGGSGWLGYRLSDSAIPLEGLSLQIYATVIRATQEANVVIPSDNRDYVYEYLVHIPGRPFNPNRSAGTFRISFLPHQGVTRTIYSPVNFLWYPWAIEGATRWLATARPDEPAERVTRVRRALGYLVVDLRDSMVEETTKESPYMSSEILIALSSL